MGGGGSAMAGGRTTLAGTFVAERTHQEPLVYTLVSVASHGAGGPGGSQSSERAAAAAQGNSRKGRGVFSERAPIQCTVLEALKNDDHYLSPDDPPQHPCVPSSAAGGEAEGSAPSLERQRSTLTGAAPAASSSPSRGVEGRGLKTMRSFTASGNGGDDGAGPGNADGDAQAADAPQGAATTAAESPGAGSPRPGTPGDVFNRLTRSVRQPWVASRTDAQLLSYLAERGRDPQVAQGLSGRSISSPSPSSFASSSMSSSTRRRRRYQNHHELFDDCLSRASTASRVVPAPTPSVFLGAKGSRRLVDLVEEIKVLPEDPVGAYMQLTEEREARRRSSGATVVEVASGPQLYRLGRP